jgi:hypothetical protein
LGLSQESGRGLIFWDSPKKEGESQSHGRSPKYWEGEEKQGVSRKHGRLLIIWEAPRNRSLINIFSKLDGGQNHNRQVDFVEGGLVRAWVVGADLNEKVSRS